MARRYHEIKGLAEYTAKTIVSDEEQWKKFLHTAGHMYKYPFREQMLIYAQRPDATACASLELWNEKMNCWVNKGAQGIALIDEEGVHRSGLKYVFDVKDVHEARFIGRKPRLWRMEEEHKGYVIDSLEKIYGETDASRPFENRIMELANRIASEMAPDIVSDQLSMSVEGSYLDGLDELNLEVRLQQTLAASIAYTVLERCGMDADIVGVEFPYLHEFNSIETLSVMGEASSELSGPILREIGRSISIYDREKAQEAVRAAREEYIDHQSARGEKRLANASERGYNALTPSGEERGNEYIESAVEGAERSDYADRVHSERRLSDPEPDSEQRAGGNAHEVRTDEEELSEGAQKRSIQRDASEGNVERALSDNTGAGRSEDGSADRADGEGSGRGRADEAQRSDEVGRSDEQHQELSGGDSFIGADLQLNPPEEELKQLNLFDLFPSFEEQMGNMIAAEASVKHEKPAAFSLSDNQINEILRTGGGMEDSRKRIYAKYQEHKSPAEMAEFLKTEYRTTGKGFTFGDSPVSVWFDEGGMKAGFGTSARENTVLEMGWAEVESHIRGMVEGGTYMNRAEAFLVDQTERARVANHIYFFFRDGLDEMPESLQIAGSNYPDSEAHLMEMLSTSEGRNIIAGELEKAKAALDSGEAELRWRCIKSPEYLLDEVADLDMEKIEFPTPDSVDIKQESFITQDEIDSILTGGSGVSGGKLRIYEYFQQGHDSKDNIAFLKNEYGTGGRSHALIGNDQSWEDHDAKGIKLSKGSIMEPYATAILSWNIVEKRIRELVAEDRYLNQAEKEELESRYLESAAEELSDEENTADRAIADEEREIAESIQPVEESAEKVLTADDIQNIQYISAEYSNFGHTAEYELEADIDGERQTLHYEVTRHDGDEESFSIHTDENDVYDRLSGAELTKLEEKLSDEVRVGRYAQKIEKAESMEDLDNIRFEFMDDESFPRRLTGRFWEAYGEKENDLSPTPDDDLALEPETKEESTERAPVVDKTGAENFRITDDRLGAGGPKEKFRRNIAAIETLKQVESEMRVATPEEQQILSQYVGWGGLADAFDESKGNWSDEYVQLKGLLTDEEYKAARESTLNAHYTSPVIIRGIYEALGNMGFEKGNVLEPAMGVGNFFGMLPEKMQDSRLYGVELDDITGRIARQLYPKADVRISGFEKTDFQNDFFDVAVGNVPFGNYQVPDRAYDKLGFQIHDYFFAKTLDKVRPGGIVAFVTSKGTMDKQSPQVRKYLAQRAELVGAVRLPNTAFKENAGTEVTSDILFFKKRDRLMDIEPDWVHLSTNADGISMNQYFADHPEMIVGRMAEVSGPHGMETACLPDESRPFEEQLRDAIRNISATYEAVELEEGEELAFDTIPADPNVKNYSYCVVDDKVYYR